jgi:hypothetical protein
MAADVGKVYPADLKLLKEELSVQGDLLEQERLERKTEIDELRLELETLRHYLEEKDPEFRKRFCEIRDRKRQKWNPELRKHA